ncbi:hypothetical protein [Haladaptatus salinisoli]|uniref:hypothetical protein n=1 Tax=Haladaptatus salinisoli TaxID=2884876 RepID=UPI001D0AC46D|nr:hypothetical protein [Haladaptatus salinisoli]
MIEEDGFCPRTGAKLSQSAHYTENGKQRVAVADAFGVSGTDEGELTKGAVRSSKVALFNYFRRCHQEHCDDNKTLYRKTALVLNRLKKAATGSQHKDLFIWYALQLRLYRRGFSVEWMHTHSALRCPHCHSPLKYTKTESDIIEGYCLSNCTNEKENKIEDIRQIIADLYNNAFDEPITSEQILQFKRD